MKITRCANAGILLEIDGISILLDGVCQKLDPYIQTPEEYRREFVKNVPDIVAFTHKHPDHFDEVFMTQIEGKTAIIMPDSAQEVTLGGVTVIPVETRHIGVYKIAHTSFIIKGSRCVWFLGDASPLGIKKMLDKPDVICAPFAYANTEFAFNSLKKHGAEKIAILHMPDSKKDTANTFEAVKAIVGGDENVCIMEIGQTINL